MFLRNYWYVAALAEEVGRTPMQRQILNEPVVMYRTEAGTPVALLDMCPHRNLPLSMGQLVGDNLRCGYHGLTFDPSGKCVRVPGQVNIPPRCRARAYSLVEKWRWLWIWMGDPAQADETAIPEFYWNDDPAWTYTGGHFHIRCNYQLLVDNLLDLSHEAYVHPSTIGNDAVAETPCKTDVHGTTVRTYRLMENCPPPPLYVKLRGFAENIDRSQDITFKPPSNILIKSKSVPHGAPDRANSGLEYRVVNGITPADETSCHHFWAVPRNFAPDPEITKLFHAGSVRAFSEDVVVLEAQQAMLNRRPRDMQWIDVNADSGGVAARRVTAKLLAEEQTLRSA